MGGSSLGCAKDVARATPSWATRQAATMLVDDEDTVRVHSEARRRRSPGDHTCCRSRWSRLQRSAGWFGTSRRLGVHDLGVICGCARTPRHDESPSRWRAAKTQWTSAEVAMNRHIDRDASNRLRDERPASAAGAGPHPSRTACASPSLQQTGVLRRRAPRGTSRRCTAAGVCAVKTAGEIELAGPRST